MKKEKKDGKKKRETAPTKTVDDLYQITGQLLKEELQNMQRQGLSNKESEDVSKLARIIADGVLGDMGI